MFILLIPVSCKTEKKEPARTWRTKEAALKNQVHNQLYEAEKEQGWQLLFDGKTLEGWHLYQKPDSTKASAWQVKNGTLYCNATDESRVHGDLVTDRAYENYELSFEWKIDYRGNSGVFINVQERPEIPTTYRSGPEYQLLGPGHMDYNVPLKRPGTIFGLSPQLNPAETLPEGQWNRSVILQENGRLRFYLNGKLTVETHLNGPEWQQKVAGSGFGAAPFFGKVAKGKIALQNWYFETWFRNMKIREL